MGSVNDSLITEGNIKFIISSFYIGVFSLILIGVSKLSWTRLQGSCYRKFKIPEVPSVTPVQLCAVFGAYSSEPRSCLIQSFGLTLNISSLSKTVSYCALQI